MNTLTPTYDAVVIGARAAGAATAMLMARQGMRVLAVDRAARGSDTLSTHALMRGAVSQLDRWGLLDAVRAAETPRIRHTTFRYGNDDVTVDIEPRGGVDALYAPRRTVLDPILVDAAEAAGVDVRHNTRLVDVVRSEDGRVCGVQIESDGVLRHVHAGLVVGADGLHSSLARKLGVRPYRVGKATTGGILKYISGTSLPTDRYLWLHQEGLLGGVIPTNDDTVGVFVNMPTTRFRSEARHDVEAAYPALLHHLAPDVASAVAAGDQVGPTRSWPGHVGQFRTAHGRGWALVGDAGYFKDPGAAHGISDAFRDAELLSDAAVAGDLAAYERRRDELSLPLFEVLEQLAGFHWTLDTLPAVHVRLSKAMSAEQSELRRHWQAQSSNAA